MTFDLKNKKEEKLFDVENYRRTGPSGAGNSSRLVKSAPRDRNRGTKQSNVTPDQALAKARARQYTGDSNLATPFQMPTHSKADFGVASVLMHPAVSELAWQAYDAFVRICRMDASDLVIGKMAKLLIPALDKEAQKILGEFDERAEQVVGRVKRVLHAKMIGEKAFRSHHSRVNVARGRLVKRLIWSTINSAIRTPANTLAPDTAPISNRMQFITEMFEILRLEFKKAWAKKNGGAKREEQRSDGKPKNQREKNHKPERGKQRMVAVRQAIVALAATD